MKFGLMTGIVAVGLTIAAWNTMAGPPQSTVAHTSLRGPGSPASAAGGSASAGLIALACSAGDHRQQLTVVDPELRVVGVYHIDSATGEIVLKSVRNIHWDLQMVEFNGSNPTPREIRTHIEQR
jgi:hypothetical protein